MHHRSYAPRSALASLAAALVVCSLAGCAGVGAPSAESERAVRDVWYRYLVSKEGRFAMNVGEPSPLWSASEQKRWPAFDLAGLYLPDRAVPEVLAVTPVDAAVDTAYRIVTRFWPKGYVPGDSSVSPLLTMTVYARREGRGWKLANALPYSTSTWARERRGRIEYRIAPGLRYDERKAARAAAFVDSLAKALDVPPPRRIEYYVASTVDEAMGILGVVGPQRYGPDGGFAKPVNAQVFSGNPALGEEYRHELAHVLVLPIIRDTTTTLLASEGLSTWLGGTDGRDYRGAVLRLDSLLTAQPQLDLHRIVYDLSVSPPVRNAAGAVLAEMVDEAGGADALREYLRTPAQAMPEAMERILRRSWDDVNILWRRRVGEIAGP